MHILFVNSSLRGSKGLTSRLIAHMVRGSEAAHVDSTVVNLAERDMLRCHACDACQRSARLGDCVYREVDDVAAVMSDIAHADIVVYATPVYVLGMSSLLKLLMERFYAYGWAGRFRLTRRGFFFHDVARTICSKPFVSLVCCDNSEPRVASNCEDYFRSFALFHDAKWLCHLVRDSGRYLLAEPGFSADSKRRIFEAFEHAGEDLGRLGVIRRATRNAAVREIIPVPWFHYLKRFRFIKRAILGRANAMEFGVASRDAPVEPVVDH